MQKEEHNIAYCICTYNHPDVILDVFERALHVYADCGIDVYVFDSSTNTSTMEIVNQYMQDYSNLFYIRMDENTTFDEKVYYLMEIYEYPYLYRYIWPIKDRIYVGEDMCRSIIDASMQGYDMIVCNVLYNEKYPPVHNAVDNIYGNASEFYGDYGWQLTSLDVAIYKMENVRGIDKKGFILESGWHSDCCFTHYMLAFYILASLISPQIYIINGNVGEDWNNSNKCCSMWTNRTFEIWVKRWYEINCKLPHIYDDYKTRVLKSATSLPWILGTQTRLAWMYQNGILNEHVLKEYKDLWGYISDIPLSDVDMIVQNRFDELGNVIIDRIIKYVEQNNIVKAVEVYTDNEWMGCTSQRERYVMLGRELKTLFL